MLDVNKLLNIAIKETDNLTQGEVFLVKDLFMGCKWNRTTLKDRLLLRILFLNRINSETISVKATPKTSSGQQKYKIIREGIQCRSI